MCHLVAGAVRAWILHLHHDEGVQEVWGDDVRDKRGGFLLEYHRHDVIPYVPFPLQLKMMLLLSLTVIKEI